MKLKTNKKKIKFVASSKYLKVKATADFENNEIDNTELSTSTVADALYLPSNKSGVEQDNNPKKPDPNTLSSHTENDHNNPQKPQPGGLAKTFSTSLTNDDNKKPKPGSGN